MLCTDGEVHTTSAGQHPPSGSYAPSSRHSSSGMLARGRDWRTELGRRDMQEAAPASTRGYGLKESARGL